MVLGIGGNSYWLWGGPGTGAGSPSVWVPGGDSTVVPPPGVYRPCIAGVGPLMSHMPPTLAVIALDLVSIISPQPDFNCFWLHYSSYYFVFEASGNCYWHFDCYSSDPDLIPVVVFLWGVLSTFSSCHQRIKLLHLNPFSPGFVRRNHRVRIGFSFFI